MNFYERDIVPLVPLVEGMHVHTAFYDWREGGDVADSLQLLGKEDTAASTIFVYLSSRLAKEAEFLQDVEDTKTDPDPSSRWPDLAVVHMLRWTEEEELGGFFVGFVAPAAEGPHIYSAGDEGDLFGFLAEHRSRLFPLSEGPRLVKGGPSPWWCMPSLIAAHARTDPATVSPAMHLIVFVVRCFELCREAPPEGALLDDCHENTLFGDRGAKDTWYIPAAALAAACPYDEGGCPSQIVVSDQSPPVREPMSREMFSIAENGTGYTGPRLKFGRGRPQLLEWLLKERAMTEHRGVTILHGLNRHEDKVGRFATTESVASSSTEASSQSAPGALLWEKRAGSLHAAKALKAGTVVGFVGANFVGAVFFEKALAGRSGGVSFPCLAMPAVVGPSASPLFQYSRLKVDEDMILLAGTGYDAGNVDVRPAVHRGGRAVYEFVTVNAVSRGTRLILDAPSSMASIRWVGGGEEGSELSKLTYIP